MRELRSLTAFLAFGLTLGGCAQVTSTADRAAASQRGEAATVEWCAQCHAPRGVETDPARGPTFEQIAHRPGRSQASLRAFLDVDHLKWGRKSAG